ncbi:MAG: nucleoside triphosphate pyrophosphohydrolase [Desulfurispora sp.]|uniref:nucleoside triphosphate pyrophosphohydrolase n=1 Tax=Desulfurispora sp. TaxID=3014275 RepID=UPI0040493928
MVSSKLIIAGLGPGSLDLLPPRVLALLQESRHVYLRTAVHPVVADLERMGIRFQTFDHLYQQADNFEEIYREIAQTLRQRLAAGQQPLVYAVPGHPLVAERSVQLLLEQVDRAAVEIVPAMSFLDALYATLRLDPAQGLGVLDGLRLAEQSLDPAQGVVITQIYSRLVAGDVKLFLLEHYPPEHRVTLVQAAGVPGRERVAEVPLAELDHQDWLDHLTSLYVPPLPGQKPRRYPLDPLVQVMADLRAPHGCPWDREQDHGTLRRYLLEEAYEVLAAIDSGDMYNLCEELGDLLLQIVFHAQIARENGYFDINDVVRGITEKMIRRHPHVFGDLQVESSRQVLANWEKIKAREKGLQEQHPSVLGAVPGHLPALLLAQKLQHKAAKVGFDWPDWRGARDKLQEEMGELARALEQGQGRLAVEEEAGDVLFAAVNLVRLAGVSAEVALLASTRKFVQRFQAVEQMARCAGQNMAECSLEQLDRWWEAVKQAQKSEK